MLWTFLYYYYFFTSAVSKQNSFSITGIKVMISGIDFDRPNCLSCLRVFPYDRFKIFTVVPIVRDRTSSLSKGSRSSQSSGSFVITQVAFPYNRPDRLNIIWDDWDDRDDPDDHMKTRLWHLRSCSSGFACRVVGLFTPREKLPGVLSYILM